MYTVLFFLSLTAMNISAQVVSLGVEGGVPLTDRVFPPDESRPYIIGPSVEFRLPARFALEAEALYQRVGTSAVFGIISGTQSDFVSYRTRGNLWEFPLLGKYYFQPRSQRWQPYVETGWAFRTAWTHTSGTSTQTGMPPSSFKDDSRSPFNVGASFGAGVRIHVSRLALSPEVRYTRWGEENLLRKNEAGILLGIHF
jgi:hypothetical protein